MRRYLLPLILLTGCGNSDFSSGPPVHGGSAGDPPYHAYGDSITAGYGLTNPGTDEYPVLLANVESRYLTNAALPGDQACDIPTRQIFPAADSPTTATPTLYTVLISTNDVDVKGSGTYESVFNLCHQATLAWLATPAQAKILASASSVTTTGATHIDTTAGFNALTTDAQGATITFNFSRTTPGPVYVWYRITDNSKGTFTYTLDSTTSATIKSTTTPAIQTQNGSISSLALLRIPGVALGAHTITLTQTSTAGGGMGIVAIGIPPSTRLAGSPRVLVGTTPLQLTPSGAPCGGGLAIDPCPLYTADITANANLLASDGLDIEIFTTTKYETGTAADLADIVHPNAQGHREILHAITDIY